MGVAIGNVVMEEKQIFQNVQMSVNFLVSLLKKNWRNEIFGSLIVIGVGLDNPTHGLAGQVVPIAIHSNQEAISWFALYPLGNFDLC
ncbi:hypothetical protein GQ457_02G033750 [Hibiscus cannabinus]